MKENRITANENQPESLSDFLLPYLDDMKQRNFSSGTIAGRALDIQRFLRFCEDRSILTPAAVTVSHIERFTRYEMTRTSEMTGKRLSVVTVIRSLSTLRSFTGYLARKGHILFNPAREIEIPKMGRRLPRNTLSAREVEEMMTVPDIMDIVGLRNRAILELLYSTGMRRGEACKLDIADLDFPGETVFIRQAKGLVDRITPVGPRALAWLQKYLKEARAGFPGSEKTEALFLSSTRCGRLSAQMISQAVARAKKASGISKQGAAHMLRHTAATLMLENGADVRYVQQFLGHRELNSTQRYTHVSIKALSDVHARTHPANFDDEENTEGEL